MQILEDGKVRKMGFSVKNRRITSDTMDDEEGGADAPRQGRNTNRASMHDAGTRETAGIKCRGKEERRKARMDARRIDAKITSKF